MSNYTMRIKLLSDACISDGGVYNSSVDIDICYTSEGFPYIPAKRIKGCLRECALELNDCGDQIPISKLFGESGNQKGVLRIGNAYIENYDERVKEIESANKTYAKI